MHSKNAYHPFLLLGFYLQFLPSELKAQIPKTTQHDWQHRNVIKQFGYDWFLQNQSLFQTLQHIAINKKLQKVNQLLITCIALKRFMQNYQQRIKNKIQDVCVVVVNRIQAITQQIPLHKCLQILQLSRQSWDAIRKTKKCTHSIFNQCVVKHPQQLLNKEIEQIKTFASDLSTIHWPLNAIYYQMKKQGLAAFHINTFYKYIRQLSLQRSLPKQQRKNHHTGIRVQQPMALVHLDITLFKTQDGIRNYIYVIQDNYSRAILYAKAFLSKSAQQMKLALIEVLEANTKPITTIQILTDDGSENNTLSTIQLENLTIQHLVALKDIDFSNSMVESAHKALKYQWLFRHSIADNTALNQFLTQAIQDINSRPHHVLKGLSPTEVFNHTPHEQIFSTPNQITIQERQIANKAVLCCASYSF